MTGKLAERQLRQILEEIEPDFTYTVHQLGLSVAALMTADMIRRRLKDAFGASRVLVHGRCSGDIAALTESFGIPFERGPDKLRDLPEFFGRKSRIRNLSDYDIRIFAEINDAPELGTDGIVRQAQDYRRDSADVIDIGCLPDTPFPHLEEVIAALKEQGFSVSVDSLEPDDLLRGGRAGADYLLSLHEATVGIVEEVASIPVLIPATHGDLNSLDRAISACRARGRPFLVDPLLDPIHSGSAIRWPVITRFDDAIPMQRP